MRSISTKTKLRFFIKELTFELMTNLTHVLLGYVSSKIPLVGIIIAALFTTYEYMQCKSFKELFSDYVEYVIGILLGLA